MSYGNYYQPPCYDETELYCGTDVENAVSKADDWRYGEPEIGDV